MAQNKPAIKTASSRKEGQQVKDNTDQARTKHINMQVSSGELTRFNQLVTTYGELSGSSLPKSVLLRSLLNLAHNADPAIQMKLLAEISKEKSHKKTIRPKR